MTGVGTGAGAAGGEAVGGAGAARERTVIAIATAAASASSAQLGATSSRERRWSPAWSTGVQAQLPPAPCRAGQRDLEVDTRHRAQRLPQYFGRLLGDCVPVDEPSPSETVTLAALARPAETATT